MNAELITLLPRLREHLDRAVAASEEADLLARQASRAADRATSETGHVRSVLGSLLVSLQEVCP